jgi:hypothetical protein
MSYFYNLNYSRRFQPLTRLKFYKSKKDIIKNLKPLIIKSQLLLFHGLTEKRDLFFEINDIEENINKESLMLSLCYAEDIFDQGDFVLDGLFYEDKKFDEVEYDINEAEFEEIN